eukprot:3138193-Pyramimonas_sp.AAC.2
MCLYKHPTLTRGCRPLRICVQGAKGADALSQMRDTIAELQRQLAELQRKLAEAIAREEEMRLKYNVRTRLKHHHSQRPHDDQ